MLRLCGSGSQADGPNLPRMDFMRIHLLSVRVYRFLTREIHDRIANAPMQFGRERDRQCRRGEIMRNHVVTCPSTEGSNRTPDCRRSVLARIIGGGGGGPLFSISLLFLTNCAEAQLTITPANLEFGEFATRANIVIRTTGTPVTVNYSTKDGTATAPEDYESRSRSGINLGASSFTLVVIPIVNDSDAEDDEHFFLTVNGTDHRITIQKNDQPQSVFSISPRTVSITEGDTQNFTVTMNPASTLTATVRCQTLSGGDAVAGQDYTVVRLSENSN